MRKLTLLTSLALVLLALQFLPTAVVAQNETVRGEPEFEAFLPQNTVEPGEQVNLQVQLRNVGEIDEEGLERLESTVTTARSVTVTPSSSDDIEVRTGESAFRDIPREDSIMVPVTVVVPQNADSTNDLELSIDYEHTREIDYNSTTDEIIDSFDTDSSETEQVQIEVVDQARFDGERIQSDVAVGETGITTLSVENVGDEDVEKATLQLQSSSRNVLFGGSQSTSIEIGDLNSGESESFETTVTFGDSASVTEYSLNGVMEYTNENGQSRTASVNGLSVQPLNRIEIPVQSVETDTSIGSSGVTEIEVENDGPKDLSDATIQLSSQSGAVLFEGRSPQTTVSIGEWDSGDTETFSVRTIVTDDATETSYSVSGTVMYENSDGISNRVSVSSFTVEPLQQQDFQVLTDSSNLREGEKGQVVLQVTNEGPKEAEDITVDISSSGSANLLSEQFNIGSLNADDSTLVNVPVEVPEDVDDLVQPLDVETEYDYDDDNTDVKQSALSVEIDENRNLFQVESVDGQIEAGASKTIQVDVTNTLNEDVSNLDAEFGASGPISVSQDNAFISSLSSDETTSLNVQISADSGAVLNTYPLEVDFQYEESDGTERLSKVYSVPVDVQEPTEDSGNSTVILVGVGVVVLIIVGLIVYFRDRIRDKIS